MSTESAGVGPIDMLAAEPAWAEWLAEGEAIQARAARVAAQGAEFAQALTQARDAHDQAVRQALAAGERIPEFVELDGRHIDVAQAFVERERLAHERVREETLRSVAPAVRRALRERIETQTAELRPVAERVEQLAADVRASLRLESELLATLDVARHERPSRSSRVEVDLTAAELLDAARTGQDVLELRPVSVVDNGARAAGFTGAFAHRVTREDEAAAARSRELRASGVLTPQRFR